MAKVEAWVLGIVALSIILSAVGLYWLRRWWLRRRVASGRRSQYYELQLPRQGGSGFGATSGVSPIYPQSVAGAWDVRNTSKAHGAHYGADRRGGVRYDGPAFL